MKWQRRLTSVWTILSRLTRLERAQATPVAEAVEEVEEEVRIRPLGGQEVAAEVQFRPRGSPGAGAGGEWPQEEKVAEEGGALPVPEPEDPAW